MFYQCPKCKKNWQYPIEKCPHCFSALQRISTNRAKVVGISRVTIPTMLHPKVPYFVLLLEDERENRWVQKSNKEYKIGEELKLGSLRDKKTVAIWRIKYDILEAIERTIDLIGGIMIDQSSKILVLPTVVAPKHPYLSENTSPDFLDNLIKYLLLRGAATENIKVAGQSFDETPIEASAQKSQLLRVCQKYNIVPLDLAKGGFIKKDKDGLNLEITEEVFKSDLIINLPILKLNQRLGVKGAAENLTKFLKKESYLASLYLTSLPDLIEKLQSVLPEHLTVAEALKIQKTSGFNAFLGLVLAGFNASNIDRTIVEIVMKKDLPEHLKKIKIEEIPIVGRKIAELQYDFENV